MLQAATIMLGALVLPRTSVYAAPDCQAVAESIKAVQSKLADAWAAKNAGGEEELARTYSHLAHRAYDEIDQDDVRVCLNADGRIRLAALASKGNTLNAALAQTSAAIKSAIQAERNILAMGMLVRNANPTYWRAMNADLAKMQRRYDEVARTEAAAASARRQAALRVTHGHDARDASHIATMDAKASVAHSKPFNGPADTSGQCARPNSPATTIHAVEPDTPPMAQQQNVSGTVQVLISLDANSRITNARIQSSPSALLNAAALAAALQSTFQTEIRDCKPVPIDFVYSVEFSSQ